MAADVAGFVEKLDTDPVTIIGHSMSVVLKCTCPKDSPLNNYQGRQDGNDLGSNLTGSGEGYHSGRQRTGRCGSESQFCRVHPWDAKG